MSRFSIRSTGQSALACAARRRGGDAVDAEAAHGLEASRPRNHPSDLSRSFDAPLDVVSDRPDFRHLPALGIGQVPVHVALAGEHRAGVAAAPSFTTTSAHSASASFETARPRGSEGRRRARPSPRRPRGGRAPQAACPRSAASLLPSAARSNSASAICDRPALCRQTKRTRVNATLSSRNRSSLRRNNRRRNTRSFRHLQQLGEAIHGLAVASRGRTLHFPPLLCGRRARPPR